jgi:hypothetical protein
VGESEGGGGRGTREMGEMGKRREDMMPANETVRGGYSIPSVLLK